MKKMILTIALAFSIFTPAAHANFWDIIGALAGSSHPSQQGPSRPGPYPPYNVSCTYTDTGWEEHWGGHNSCGECLSKHGNCYETCSTQTEVCEAKGTDRNGTLVTVSGESPDRYDSERRAYDSCYYHGLQDCRVDICTTREDQVSRRLCR
jgi:hypothetical protein